MKRKNLLSLTITIFGIILVVNLVRSITNLWQKGEIIDDYVKRLSQVIRRNEDLKKGLARAQSPEYIERQAREKLNLGKEGENVVILPPITPSPTPPLEENLSNWQRWLRLFF
jgi:cell division protein FtsB